MSWKEKGHKSIPQAQYVTLRIKKSDEEKPKCVGLAQQNRFCSHICAQFAEAGKRCSKAVHILEKSAINMI